MNVSARNRYGKSFYAACRLVYCGSVVAACHNGFGLTPDAVLFGNFKRLFIELAVIDGSPVHKADNGTAAQTADLFSSGTPEMSAAVVPSTTIAKSGATE